jgi:hypothetical protein
LNTARFLHTATLLPGGKVLISGGCSISGCTSDILASSELYDPGGNTWTNTDSFETSRTYQTATLLLTGKVLIAGGWNGSIYSSAEVYDLGLRFAEAWRSTVSTISSPLIKATPISLTGSGFRGYQLSEASGGGTYNSATNYPLVQIRRLDNEQITWASPASFSGTSYASLPVTNMQNGPAIVTVFVNGIPSLSKLILLKDYYYIFLPLILKLYGNGANRTRKAEASLHLL